MQHPRRLAWIAVAAVAAAGVWWALRPRPVVVEVSAVERGVLEATVDAEATTRVRERMTLAAPLSGQLAPVTLRAGDDVEAGAVIARLTPLPSPLLDARARAEAVARREAALAGQRQAEAASGRARAALRFARTEAQRQRALAMDGAATRQAAELADLAVETSTRDLQAAEQAADAAAHEVALARAVLGERGPGGDQVEVRAERAGRVLRVLDEDGGPVAAGSPILELGDPAALEVIVPLLTEDAVRVHPGTPVRFDGYGGPQPLAGVVRRVEPSAFTRVSALGVEEQRVNVIVDPSGNRSVWLAIGDGYRMQAHVVVWSAPRVVTVPLGALYRDARGEWAVLIARDGRAAPRGVKLGERGGRHAQVLEGLAPGEQVILHPGARVAAGARVRAEGNR
jgi:HlyD family secretion protein